MKKTYKVWLKPCEEYPDGSWCVDPRDNEDEEDKEGNAVFYTKKAAKRLVKYFCETWTTNSKDAYEIVCSHDVVYCVWFLGTDLLDGLCHNLKDRSYIKPFFTTSKKEAKEYKKKMCGEHSNIGATEEMYAICEILIPKKKES